LRGFKLDVIVKLVVEGLRVKKKKAGNNDEMGTDDKED
jgi:hypothetical protein